MRVRVGTDLVETGRIEAMASRWGDRFFNRVFTAAELEWGRSRRRRWTFIAGRFAAKEALIKLLGIPVSFQEMEVMADSRGAPLAHLHGKAQERAAELGIYQVSLTITHTRSLACATAVALEHSPG